ncbi:MAG: hypothetical protein M0Q51_05290 [Bacteroidales bacterium]|nr:hypothetical protein [Bacteroidales bacterium]
MKKIHLVLLILFLFSFGTMAQSGGKPMHLKPTNFQKKVTTVISGKTRNYYSLSTVEPSIITIQGPGMLKVNTRGQFKPGEGDLIKYAILYTVDGGVQKSVTNSSVARSKEATFSDGTFGVPAQLKSFEIELLRGNHTIEFKLKENLVNVSARYIFTPTKVKKQEWLAFSPMQPSEPVDLISRETTTAYYRFSMEKHLKVEINGPTELRVLTRTENQYQMKGRINYRVQVKENGIVLNTYQLNSKLSEIAVYKDVKELIPGTAREFVIYVPKGKHIYEILPLDQDKGTLLGRMLIPKKDVILEK